MWMVDISLGEGFQRLPRCYARSTPQEHNDFARRTNPYGLLLKRRGANMPGAEFAGPWNDEVTGGVLAAEVGRNAENYQVFEGLG